MTNYSGQPALCQQHPFHAFQHQGKTNVVTLLVVCLSSYPRFCVCVLAFKGHAMAAVKTTPSFHDLQPQCFLLLNWLKGFRGYNRVDR